MTLVDYKKIILYSLYMAISLGLYIACDDDIKEANSAKLEIDTSSITFTPPLEDAIQSTVSISIKHLSGGVARIASVKLKERDIVKELSIVDRDDWQNTQLQNKESRNLEILWTPRDEKPDQADLEIITNIGDFLIELNTPDLDASFVLSSSNGILNAAQNVIEIKNVTAGKTRDIPVSITSVGLAPLVLKNICILDTNGRCKEIDRSEKQSLLVCQAAQSNACIPIEPPDLLILGSSYTFAIRYYAAARLLDTESVNILIESNSSEQQRFTLNVRATPCVLGVNAERCGLCGNGEVDPDEVCDDANLVNTDSCKSDCTLNTCGDGVIYEGVEVCDDGNQDDSDACLMTCQLPVCGDGIKSLEEQCDDGNTDESDACLNDCKLAQCGDGIVSVEEECDDGNDDNSDMCLSDCRLSGCGDGIVNGEEECDDGNEDDSDQCLSNCRMARCGDGVRSLEETCDDGNNDDSDLCLSNCQMARCGDGVRSLEEECDDGNMSNTDGCLNDCKSARCGDGYLWDTVEECDDSMMEDRCPYGVAECQICGDLCLFEIISGGYCGDGMIQIEEDCDDGNAVSETCPYDSGVCTICNSNCLSVESVATFCGDEIINGDEACDGQEGCGENCQILPDADPCTPFCPILDWIDVGAISYTMGYNMGSEQEAPAHQAIVSAFQMTRTEVTVAQYQTCVDAGVCEEPRGRNDNPQCNWGVQNRQEHPLNCITWQQARDFAQWVGGDLPSEAQWERVARGVSAQDLYPWGIEEATCERAIMSEEQPGCGRSSTWTTCSLNEGVHPDGFCDLIGNLWEWTLDIYQPYTDDLQTEQARCTLEGCTSSGVNRTLRGGGWNAYNTNLRATIREGYADQLALNFFGFRCVKN